MCRPLGCIVRIFRIYKGVGGNTKKTNQLIKLINMAVIHFLNVLEGDCNIIEHDSGRLTMIDVSNAYNDIDTEEEKKVQASKEREERRLRTLVPTGKVNYKQKETPDNPIL